MKIEFIATLQGAGCIRIDDDGASIVKMTLDGGQLAGATKMVLMKGKTFRVTVEDDK